MQPHRLVRWAGITSVVIGGVMIGFSFKLVRDLRKEEFPVWAAPLATNEQVLKNFRLARPGEYQLALDLKSGEKPPRMHLEWSLSADGAIVVKGRSDQGVPDILWGKTIEQVLARFHGTPDQQYAFSVRSITDQSELKNSGPRLKVEPEPLQKRGERNAFALTYLFGRVILGLGIVLLILSRILRRNLARPD